MLHKRRSKESSLNAGAPQPSFMSKEQMAQYLTELRSNRPARPSGSRPQPYRNAVTSNPPAPRVPSGRGPSPRLPGSRKVSPTYSSDGGNSVFGSDAHRRTRSAMSGFNSRSSSGSHGMLKDDELPASLASSTKLSGNDVNAKYTERGQRWMEKQEARSLREALQAMDMREDPHLYIAAQNEASELVWQHQNYGFTPKDPAAPKRFTEHLRKGSHARSQSMGEYSVLDGVAGSTGTQRQERKFSNMSVPELEEDASCNEEVPVEIPGIPTLPLGKKTQEPLEHVNGKVHALWDSPQKKAYMSLSLAGWPSEPGDRRRSSGSRPRNVSGGRRPGEFPNPEDQIYEEPEEESAGTARRLQESAVPAPLGAKLRNPLAKVRLSYDAPPRSNTTPISTYGKPLRDDARKLPSAPVRASPYTTNNLPLTAPRVASEDVPRQSVEGPPMRDGKEIRGDDIREATSMKLRDRSPRLPSPAFVSDSPDRPIVSFDGRWKPKDPKDNASMQRQPPESRGSDFRRQSPSPLRARDSATPTLPTFHTQDSSAPAIPTINVPEAPSSSVNGPSVPPMRAPSEPTSGRPAARALPTPKGAASRPLPHHSASAPPTSCASRYSLSTRRPTASCTQCQLPIAGRIVSAAGERFHPECFICFHCGEGLECVAFYPEPENKRAERVERIQRRARGEHVEETDRQGEAEDGNEALRFYCHLDFHEFFSPRCRSCKTPIEGEVVLACGGEWHVGHFFCAQCGDPFDPSTPFVEKEGYAWCINCHTNRFSNKCKKCRKPVTDMVVEALGSEWHAECFCCVECGGDFEDGRYFLRGNDEIPVCVKCEEKRLKA